MSFPFSWNAIHLDHVETGLLRNMFSMEELGESFSDASTEGNREGGGGGLEGNCSVCICGGI